MKLLNLQLTLALFMSMFLITSCGSDDDVTPSGLIASFQAEPSTDNFATIIFTNFSTDATSYAWDFGDGNSSTEESPTHTYAAGGDYNVTLTASNADDSATFSRTITITDPNQASKLLTGETSKTWKLFREGTSMSVGPDASNPAGFWPGLTNDGSRPCLYEQEFTFSADGTYTFDDKGMFWGESGVWNDTDVFETCFEPTAANMTNASGADLSAWGSGTHSFTYDPSSGDLTLIGEGAWIGIPKLGTTGENVTPASSVSTKITITEAVGYDLMFVEFIYDGVYWPIYYASYSDASLEPALVTEEMEFGEDLPDISPAELSHTFESTDGNVLIDTIMSGSFIEYGADDPTDADAAKVGKFFRIADVQFQELQFQTSPDKNDINFENITTVSMDVYLPSSNDYSTTLTKGVIIGLGDRSQTEQWWTDNIEFINDGANIELDTWTTLTYDISMPSFSASGSTPLDRNDLDMIYLNIGGSGHGAGGEFFVRNLTFN